MLTHGSMVLMAVDGSLMLKMSDVVRSRKIQISCVARASSFSKVFADKRVTKHGVAYLSKVYILSNLAMLQQPRVLYIQGQLSAIDSYIPHNGPP